MRLVVSGATSGTGNAVASRLVARFGAEAITCLVRPTSDTRPLDALGLRTAVGDVTDREFMCGVLDSGVVYVDMTHPKHYNQSLAAVMAAGVERAYFITTTGVFSRYNHCAEIYRVNEERIRNSGVVYTILRPSMIYGSARDKNMNRLIRFLDRYPIFPLFGGGRSLMQPVFVDDLADGIVAAIGNPVTEYREYNLCGPEGIAYREIVQTVMSALGRRVALLPINTRLAALTAAVAQHIPGFPVTREQVLRLLEDKVYDISAAVPDLSFRPRPFDQGIRAEIDDLRRAGLLRQR